MEQINLEKATAQQVFDYVVRKLFEQGCKSTVSNDGDLHCAYRGNDGTKCAGGWLIRDEQYNPKMEGYSWMVVVGMYDLCSNHMDLVTDLQDIHDSYGTQDWRKAFKYVAEKHHLNTKILEEVEIS
mgnify:CR=1 FL=1